MSDEFDDDPEQFSAETRDALRRSVNELSEGLARHAELLCALRGGSSDVPALLSANDEIRRLVDAWNERVFDHTGTSAVSLDVYDEDDEDLPDDDPVEVVDGQPLTVVSRWDLVIADAAALLRVGRDAYRRLWPEEDEADAEAAVTDPEQALYTVLHEQGEPLLAIPGVEMGRGARLFVRPDDTAEDVGADGTEVVVSQPDGEVLFTESWH